MNSAVCLLRDNLQEFVGDRVHHQICTQIMQHSLLAVVTYSGGHLDSLCFGHLDDEFSECRCSGCDQEPLASLQVRFLEHCKSRHWIDKSLTRRLIRHCIGHRNHQG